VFSKAQKLQATFYCRDFAIAGCKSLLSPFSQVTTNNEGLPLKRKKEVASKQTEP